MIQLPTSKVNKSAFRKTLPGSNAIPKRKRQKNLMAKLDEAKRERDRLRKELEESAKAAKEYAARTEVLKGQVASLEKSIQQVTKEHNDLQGEREKKPTMELTEEKQEIDRMRKELTRLTDVAEERGVRVSQLRQQVGDLQEFIREQRHSEEEKAKNLTAELEQARQDIYHIQEELEESTKAAEEYAARTKVLQGQVTAFLIHPDRHHRAFRLTSHRIVIRSFCLEGLVLQKTSVSIMADPIVGLDRPAALTPTVDLRQDVDARVLMRLRQAIHDPPSTTPASPPVSCPTTHSTTLVATAFSLVVLLAVCVVILLVHSCHSREAGDLAPYRVQDHAETAS